VAADGVVRLQLPAGSPPVVLNTTAANATADGFVTVYPCDVSRPDASNLNFQAGEAIPNLVITRVAADGTVCLYTNVPADLVADVNGWLPTDELYVPMAPERVQDGRHCDVAVYTVDGEIYADDFDLGYTNDLGPTSRPGQTVSSVLPPMVVSGDCWVYVKVTESVDGQSFQRLERGGCVVARARERCLRRGAVDVVDRTGHDVRAQLFSKLKEFSTLREPPLEGFEASHVPDLRAVKRSKCVHEVLTL
jgi:hypothetical protein